MPLNIATALGAGLSATFQGLGEEQSRARQRKQQMELADQEMVMRKAEDARRSDLHDLKLQEYLNQGYLPPGYEGPQLPPGHNLEAEQKAAPDPLADLPVSLPPGALPEIPGVQVPDYVALHDEARAVDPAYNKVFEGSSTKEHEQRAVLQAQMRAEFMEQGLARLTSRVETFKDNKMMEPEDLELFSQALQGVKDPSDIKALDDALYQAKDAWVRKNQDKAVRARQVMDVKRALEMTSPGSPQRAEVEQRLALIEHDVELSAEEREDMRAEALVEADPSLQALYLSRMREMLMHYQAQQIATTPMPSHQFVSKGAPSGPPVGTLGPSPHAAPFEPVDGTSVETLKPDKLLSLAVGLSELGKVKNASARLREARKLFRKHGLVYTDSSAEAVEKAIAGLF